MCILLKLHYAKFEASRLFCSKVIEEKPLGVGSTLGKGRVKPGNNSFGINHIIRCGSKLLPL